MSIFDKLFGATPNLAAAPAPAQQTNAPTNDPAKMQQNQQTAVSAKTDANGVVPANSNGESPLEKFGDLWKPKEIDPNAPKPPTPVTPEQIMEAAGTVDFAKVLSQEDLVKVTQGGEGAVAALASILNKTMQTSYGHSALAATRLVEQAVGKAKEEFASQLPSLINQQSSKNALLADNPAFKNPAVAPIVEMIHNQLVDRFPTATPAEIAAMAKEMMSGAAQVFSPQSANNQQSQTKVAAAEDWGTYLN